MSETFHYEPLTGDDIRVLRVQPLSSPSDADSTPLSMTLDHLNPHQKSATPFWAMSYVWGSTKDPQTVQINGTPFQVTSNLHEALVQYRRQFLNHGRRAAEAGVDVLWIDAICINQKDYLEKSVQVPRMKEVYGRCERVLAWLGPVNEEEEADMALVAETLDHVDEEVKTGAKYPDVTEAFRETSESTLKGRERLEKIRMQLLRLGCREWFRRVWILQEYALAVQTPMFLFGPHITNYWTFTVAWTYLVLHPMAARGITSIALFQYDPCAYLYVKQSRIESQNEEEHGSSSTRDKEFKLGSKILKYLDETNRYGATMPHDYIYALLGLVDSDDLPEELKPDYDKPFETVYHEYMAFLLRTTHDTRALMLGPLGTIDGVPSWVPDLRNRLAAQWVTDVRPLTRTHDITVSADSKSLILPAISLGKVISSFPSQGPLAREPETYLELNESAAKVFGLVPENVDFQDIMGSLLNILGRTEVYPASAFQRFEQSIIAEAANRSKKSFQETMEIWQRFRLRRMFGAYHWSFMEPLFSTAYRAMVSEIPIRRDSAHLSDEGITQEDLLDMDAFLRQAKIQDTLLGLPQFVLDDGRIGHLQLSARNSPMPSCEIGDLVVVLRGNPYPFLVRPVQEGKYRLISGGVVFDELPNGFGEETLARFERSFEMAAREEDTESAVIVRLEVI
ncbi:hypothetical protein Daus18300_010931 [Diaporthe australafricana]|uniref:Heterokaryon incompatibility domain-containing protein n=1 Tax=Diaporthe australafricana TaxID=127596 RepID=A0ABR3W8N6_9PEZI